MLAKAEDQPFSMTSVDSCFWPISDGYSYENSTVNFGY